ncbi:MAG TPA: ABC transporter permease [Edaphocola sp.]|nr:ABC transporter permease [Edaphocola sp.]
MASLAILCIFLTVLVAIFAYPLAADKSPNANTMIVELSAKPVGYKKHFLKVQKANLPKEESFFKRTFLGTAEKYNWIPINGWVLLADGIQVRHYIDDGLEDNIKYSYKTLGVTSHQEVKKLLVVKSFPLGTDRYGRDIYSRILIGSRVSMGVGIISVLLSISIGILMGTLSGWYGGWIDYGIMWFVNILWAIPTLLLVFAITLTIGKGFWEVFIAIGLSSWVSAARLIRGQVMQIKEQDFIVAAKALGFKDFRIIYKHILPNIAGPIIVIAAANFATAILVEAGLSFLGIGVQPPMPSWGLMIKEHYNFLIAGKPIPALLPGIAIMILVLAFNILGNAIRDILDVKNERG